MNSKLPRGRWVLTVDIGNTNVTLGAFAAEAKGVVPVPWAVWRMSTHRHTTSDEAGLALLGFFNESRLDRRFLAGVAVASVVPPLDPVFRGVCSKYFHVAPLFVDASTKTGVRVLYDAPSEVGADRIVNAAAAFARVRGPLIVTDFGTATTFDCVDKDGSYLGGAIAPGPHMAAETLYQRTAKLPLLGSLQEPPFAIGKNTVDSITSGLFHGYVGLTRGLLAVLSKEMGSHPTILATGGLASLFASSLPEIAEVLPNLTLEGLWRIWKEN